MDQSLTLPGSGAAERDGRDEYGSPTRAPQEKPAQTIQLGTIATNREVVLQGRRAFERGEDAEALESLGRLVAHGVRYADVHYMLGLLRERSGDVEGALEDLGEAIRINPAYVEALLALASVHERTGEYKRSEGFAERASRLSRPSAGGLDPTTRGKLANQQAALAEALAAAGERRGAIAQYRGALERCPTFHDIRHRLGVALREAGLVAQAAREFRLILRRHPGYLDSQIQLGLTYYSMGRTPEAIEEWEAVVQKDPERNEAWMYLRLVRGVEHETSDCPDASVASSDEAGSDPGSPGWKTTGLARGRDQ